MKIRPGIVTISGEGEEPAALADDVKHGSGPLPSRRPRGVGLPAAANSSSLTPNQYAFRDQLRPTTQRRIERVTTIALNIETRTPMIRTRAKPRIVDEPKR